MSLRETRGLRRWWGRVLHFFFLSCQRYMRQESARRVRPVGAWARARGLGHRMICRICRAQVRTLDEMTEQSAALGTDEGGGEPGAMPPEARARLREALLAAQRERDPPDPR